MEATGPKKADIWNNYTYPKFYHIVSMLEKIIYIVIKYAKFRPFWTIYIKIFHIYF